MEEQKYYTPALEDIRMGLECELWASYKNNFIPTTLLNAQIIWVVLNHGALNDYIRVPNLTAVQVESEGWILNLSDDRHFSAVKDNSEHYIRLSLHPDNRLIIRRNGAYAYNGFCRCINDFRLICKLIGI